MIRLNIVQIEEHEVNGENCLLVGVERMHSSEKLQNAMITFKTIEEKTFVNIFKNSKTISYILNIDKDIINKYQEFMMIELSQKNGNINYVVSQEY